jgi:hypothetical protein
MSPLLPAGLPLLLALLLELLLVAFAACAVPLLPVACAADDPPEPDD